MKPFSAVMKNLKRIRTLRGLSQSQLAALMGQDARNIGQYENGKAASSKKIHEYAKALLVTPKMLCGCEVPEPTAGINGILNFLNSEGNDYFGPDNALILQIDKPALNNHGWRRSGHCQREITFGGGRSQ